MTGRKRYIKGFPLLQVPAGSSAAIKYQAPYNGQLVGMLIHGSANNPCSVTATVEQENMVEDSSVNFFFPTTLVPPQLFSRLRMNAPITVNVFNPDPNSGYGFYVSLIFERFPELNAKDQGKR